MEVHTFLSNYQIHGLMRLSGFECHSDSDCFTKQHWEDLIDEVDRIYEGKELRLDGYRVDGTSNSNSDYRDSSSLQSTRPPPPVVDRQQPPDVKADSSAPAYPKFLILQGIPASHSDPIDIYDFLKTNNILFNLDKRDIVVTVPANTSADHTASIRFQTHEDAVEAYTKITNTIYYNSRILYVDYSMTAPARVLFMYKIIRYVTKESLADGLKTYCKQGFVEKVDLPMNSSFGYVTLSEIDDAIRIYRNLLKSAEGGMWVPVADSNCGEQVLVFFKYSKFPDPPRQVGDQSTNYSDKVYGQSGGNLKILRVKNLHEHDLTDLESICKRAGECNRVGGLLLFL
jgi:hypothetical protein